MALTSFEFLLFISAVFLGYFIFPKKYRWVWLLLTSIYFYLSASVICVSFLLLSITSSYLFGVYCNQLTAKRESFYEEETDKELCKAYKKQLEQKRKRAAAAVILFNLAILGVLKYAGFVFENISRIVRLFIPVFGLPGLELVLPLGISFYTFMAIGYCIDVYREVIEGEKNPFKLALFLSFFPHIIQGPIDRYDELAFQLYEGHSFDYDRVTQGLYRMLWGFFEKLVVADRLAILVNTVIDNSNSYSGLYLVIAIFCYAVQIYADFAGYMDIALGAAKIIGISPAENFDVPYFAATIPEFWRRWHMTLGSWFRDYLFYPILRSSFCKKITKGLQGKVDKSTIGTITTCLALCVVWFTTGLWHGASWHYIAWGVYYGVLIILSTVTKPFTKRISKMLRINRDTNRWKLYCIAKTFLLVLLGYIFFRAKSLICAISIIFRIATKFAPAFNAPNTDFGLDCQDMVVAVAGILVLFIADMLKYHKVDILKLFRWLPLAIRWLILYGTIAVILLFGIYGPEYDPSSFIYFQF
ncbi:MAG: MBOAT family protein [Clostridiales bacterium]|nr:MBOAT family protein [Clostridiales bacterium]